MRYPWDAREFVPQNRKVKIRTWRQKPSQRGAHRNCCVWKTRRWWSEGNMNKISFVQFGAIVWTKHGEISLSCRHFAWALMRPIWFKHIYFTLIGGVAVIQLWSPLVGCVLFDRPPSCLFLCVFRRTTEKTSTPCITGPLCWGPNENRWMPSTKASYAKNVLWSKRLHIGWVPMTATNGACSLVTIHGTTKQLPYNLSRSRHWIKEIRCR